MTAGLTPLLSTGLRGAGKGLTATRMGRCWAVNVWHGGVEAQLEFAASLVRDVARTGVTATAASDGSEKER